MAIYKEINIFYMPSFGKANDTYNKILKNPIHAIEQNRNVFIPKLV